MICGDVNVNYLQWRGKKSQLNALLNSYNLFSTVQFPTRTYRNSISATDNIFIDTTTIDTYAIIQVMNGLSDHDAQIISKETFINKYTMAELQNSLSYESWDHVFDSNDVNQIFNSFLNTYLRIFYATFPFKKINNETKAPWTTKGIKTCSIQERKLYLACRNSTNPHIKGYYKCYCNILSKVIKEAKKRHYDNQIKNSTKKNKQRNTQKDTSLNIKFLNTDGYYYNQQLIAETFNNYFTSRAENIKTTDRNTYIQNKNTPDTAIIHTSSQNVKEMRKLTCTTFQSKPATTSEIENITKILKPKNSCRYNEISNKVLKITAPFISAPLNYIRNKVITKGVFPDRLKYSIIKPLHKNVIKEMYQLLANISFNLLFKNLKKSNTEKLLDHLHKNIISKEQYGYGQQKTLFIN